mmetsp:Transcript_22701/g.31670  ORF Transcript_22701/g.31670 Transcript_22701/m.31670 type:complete len:460 (-) Transcript_22701:345-1724(-)|eukprot:CAMPEP_0196590236 /NCGR_PEP_ID=MMETSP1081-20130531/66044_1 /TAXON_ID=36882 /ORGANISM="Pyramimonas amylifera, Strain CCMP720" /LENGTH=459 /DNA_ID=CAMNT_0041913283 /DNA_START=126 /DNA_END=1505 /DNA_ORIENTATION=-
MDPLRCLRDAVIQNQLDSVLVDGEFIQFGDRFTFPRNVATSYKSQRGKGAFYSLDALVHFVKNKDLEIGSYLGMQDDSQRQLISFIDRKELLEYLSGGIETSDYIQITVPSLPSEPATLHQPLTQGALGEQFESGPLIATRVEALTPRPLKDRINVLSVRNHSFHKVLFLLAPKLEPEIAKASLADLMAPDQNVRPGQGAAEGRFWANRVATEGGEGKELRDLAINTKGTLLPAIGKRPPTAPPPSSSDQHKRSRPNEPSHRHSHHKDPKAHKSGHKDGQRPGKMPSDSAQRPIIIVPSGFGVNVLINMFNARKFLVDGVYETWEDAQKKEMRKESVMTVLRSKDRPVPIKYIVTDKPPPKTSPDWNRVVAVFTTGAKWQFKDWPFKGATEGDLVDTFHKVKGFHLKFVDTPQVEIIKDWNVTVIPINRTSRHNDRVSSEIFWKQLDNFLKSSRSTLKY